MKLSKLYSNMPDLFESVVFSQGLNIVLAEIRLPENHNKDTHNLGKTTLGRLIDFSFLAQRDPQFFLFKHDRLFHDFIFFLEIELDNNSFLTIRRSVLEPTKISFKKHSSRNQDFSAFQPKYWEHQDIPFDKAKQLLDGMLDWRALKPWSFRQGLGYLLRSQNDFRDVFQLHKFKGKHSSWKPFLAHILGFDAQIVMQHYEKRKELEDSQSMTQTLENEFGGPIKDMSQKEGILLLKQKEMEKKQALLDTFDFRISDKDFNKQLVEVIDKKIASFNAERYSLNQNKKKITTALEEDQILFDPNEAQRLFEEVGVLFEGQIKKDFQQLIDFNRAITDERRGYLQEEYAEIEVELKRINLELNALGKRRSEMLSFLSSTDIFDKYKQVSGEIVILLADIKSLEEQRIIFHRLQTLKSEIRAVEDECVALQQQIDSDIECQHSDPDCLFSTIRVFFSDIVEEVIDRKALLTVQPNREGHLEFKAEILDEAGSATSADLGHTYRKLLCIAFDLAVLRAHLGGKFPHFVYHDGVFESLDDRKKENLLKVFRMYSSLGLQTIITLIDSDLPVRQDGAIFQEDEIIVRLHDEGNQGKLFKMAEW